MKKILGILLIGIMMISLTGCGKDDYKKTYDKAIANFKKYDNYKVNYTNIEESESIANRKDYEVTIDRNNKIYKQILTRAGSKSNASDFNMTNYEATKEYISYIDSKENKAYQYDRTCTKKIVWTEAKGYLGSDLNIDNALGFMVIASTTSSDIKDYKDGVYILSLTKEKLTEIDKTNFYSSKDDKIEFKVTLDGDSLKTIEYQMKQYAFTEVVKAEFISNGKEELVIPEEYKNAPKYDENEACS